MLWDHITTMYVLRNLRYFFSWHLAELIDIVGYNFTPRSDEVVYVWQVGNRWSLVTATFGFVWNNSPFSRLGLTSA